MNPNATVPLPADAPWIVMKFGGTSVATLPRWQNIRELAASRRAEGARVLVVVSALSGITDALKQLCAEGDKGKRIEAARAIEQRHYELLGHMGLELPAALDARLKDLLALAEGGPARLGELAWEQLSKRLGGADWPPPDLLTPELVVRASTGQARRRVRIRA